jgi:MoaA/NifB/PqqE/SkfB family radical SAM enzyme
MNVEQLLLALPTQDREPSPVELTVGQWAGLVEQFAVQGGREVLLGGAEPLLYPGFWVLVRRAAKAGVPRVTAYLSGSLLEPWVLRGLVESGIHVLVSLDGLQPDVHEALHGPGSHARAMAAIDTFLKQGLVQRVGVLATVTRLNHTALPMLATWAAGKGLTRFMWSCVPDGGWPSPQLKALRLSPEEKMNLARAMHGVGRGVGSMYVGPLDMLDDPELCPGYAPLLRVTSHGDASWGFSGEGGGLGNLRLRTLKDLLVSGAQAAGD